MRIKEKGLALPLQDRLSVFNNNQLLPALAKACDQLLEPGQRVRIDKLEIDVGSVSIDKLENVLTERIVEQFKNQVQEMVFKNPSLVETVPDTGEIFSLGDAETKKNFFTKIDLFLFFLEQGTIPWWYPASNFNMKEIVDEILSHSPQLFLEKLVPLLHSRNTRLRIVDTLSDKQILQLIDPKNQFELKLIWEEIILQFESGFFTPHTLLKIKLIVFEKVLSALNSKESIPQRREKIKITTLQSVIELRPKSLTSFVKTGKIAIEELKENALLSVLVEKLTIEELEKITKDLATAKTDQVEAALLIPQKPEDKPLPRRKSPEDIYVEINNAGVVILWPYLEMFFKELDLVENKTFIDEPSRWKAVQLLHYIAFGNEEAEEHHWALNKIFCGMYISEFVPIEFELTNAEKEECNNLLQSVINNWKALKNTSIQGFQQTFLRRDGLLKNDHQGYIIEIERTTIDILLDKLSWPLSVIKLPWNNGLIHVKW